MSWTEDRKNQLKRLWLDGVTSGDISRTLGGVSRNAVMGMVNRMGLMGMQRKPATLETTPAGDPVTKAEVRIPTGEPIVPEPEIAAPITLAPQVEAVVVTDAAKPQSPASNDQGDANPIRELVAEAFGEPFDMRNEAHRHALVGMGAIVSGRDVQGIARSTGLGTHEVVAILHAFDDAGIWREGDAAPKAWRSPRHGDVSFTLDMMVASGQLMRFRDDDAADWRYRRIDKAAAA